MNRETARQQPKSGITSASFLALAWNIRGSGLSLQYIEDSLLFAYKLNIPYMHSPSENQYPAAKIEVEA